MIEIILPTIIIVLIMLIFSFTIFRIIVRRINHKVKVYFIDKLQQYDYLIDEKEKELNNLKEEIRKQKQIYDDLEIDVNIDDGEVTFNSEIERRLGEMKQFKSSMKDKQELIYDIPTPEYREEAFFNTYKELKKKFKTDNEKTITKFISEHKTKTGDSTKFKELVNLKDQFTSKIVYEMLTLKNSEQYQIVQEIISQKIKPIIDLENNFKNKDKFNVLDFLNLVDKKIKEYDPTVYVYVGDESLNYDNLGKNIKTRYYKNMSEGVIIHHKGKMYDYSI